MRPDTIVHVQQTQKENRKAMLTIPIRNTRAHRNSKAVTSDVTLHTWTASLRRLVSRLET